MDRLQEIEIQLELLKGQVQEIHHRITNLNAEKWQIIKENCDHDFHVKNVV